MTDATQDPNRPHVWWFTPDPRDVRLAELEKALQRIRTLASDATWLAIIETDIFDAIYKLAVDALAGTEPEPGDVVEVTST